eukprot:PhF_6_TR8708/c0_g1_i2/m.13664
MGWLQFVKWVEGRVRCENESTSTTRMRRDFAILNLMSVQNLMVSLIPWGVLELYHFMVYRTLTSIVPLLSFFWILHYKTTTLPAVMWTFMWMALFPYLTWQYGVESAAIALP